MKALITTHRKMLVALIAAALIALNNFAGVIIPWEASQIMDVIVALVAAFAVQGVPNV